MTQNLYLKVSTDESVATFFGNAAGTGDPITSINVSANTDIYFRKCTGQDHWNYSQIAFRVTSAAAGGTNITQYEDNPSPRTYPSMPNTAENTACVVYQANSWTAPSSMHDFTLKTLNNDMLMVQDNDADTGQTFEYYIYITTTGGQRYVCDPQIYNQSPP